MTQVSSSGYGGVGNLHRCCSVVHAPWGAPEVSCHAAAEVRIKSPKCAYIYTGLCAVVDICIQEDFSNLPCMYMYPVLCRIRDAS